MLVVDGGAAWIACCLAAGKLQVLGDGQRRKHLLSLGDEAHARPCDVGRILASQLRAADLHRAADAHALAGQIAGHRAAQRRLAGTVRAHHHRDLASGHAQ